MNGSVGYIFNCLFYLICVRFKSVVLLSAGADLQKVKRRRDPLILDADSKFRAIALSSGVRAKSIDASEFHSPLRPP